MRNGAMAADVVRTGDERDAKVMTHVVVELGGTNLWVSVHSPGGRVTRPALVAGRPDGQFPAALRVTSSGRWFWGAHRRHADDEVLVTDILSRVDDPVPLVVGSSRVPAAYLVAQQVSTLYQAVATGSRHQLVLVHPVDLSERGRAMVEDELRRRLPAGTPVAWVSRAAAAVGALPECDELVEGDVVGVLHVGGTTSEAVAWRQSATGGSIGTATVDRGHAGHALDDTLLTAVLPTEARRSDDAPVDVAHLRAACAHAKVLLSSETAADVDVAGRPVRLVRGEVEELTRRLLARQLDTLGAVLAHQPPSAAVRFVVLVGGGAGAPYLVEAASERFDVPVLSIPRVGEALSVSALPTPSGAEATAVDRPEPEGAAEAHGATDRDPAAATRRPWAGHGPLPARLRRRAGAVAVPARAVSATPGSGPVGRPVRIVKPRPVHLGVAATALLALWAGAQSLGLSHAGGAPTATAAAAAAGPLGLGVQATDQGAVSSPDGLAFTPGSSTYSVPPWLTGSHPTGATLGPAAHPLSMVSAGTKPSTTSSTTSSPAATSAASPSGTATRAGGSASPSSAPAGASAPAAGSAPAGGPAPATSAASPPAVKSTPAGGTASTPVSGSGAVGSTPASPSPSASTPQPVATGNPGPAVAPDPPPATTSAPAPAPAPVPEATSPAAVDAGGGSAGEGAADGSAAQPQAAGAPANGSANVAADSPTP